MQVHRARTGVVSGLIGFVILAARCAAADVEWENVTGNVGGDHWGYNGVCLLVAVPGSERIIAGVSENGLWASDDNARTWHKLGVQDKEQIKHRTHQIIFDPKDPSTFWVSGNYGAVIFKSTDWGYKLRTAWEAAARGWPGDRHDRPAAQDNAGRFA